MGEGDTHSPQWTIPGGVPISGGRYKEGKPKSLSEWSYQLLRYCILHLLLRQWLHQKTCEINIDECQSLRCQHYGTCADEIVSCHYFVNLVTRERIVKVRLPDWCQNPPCEPCKLTGVDSKCCDYRVLQGNLYLLIVSKDVEVQTRLFYFLFLTYLLLFLMYL